MTKIIFIYILVIQILFGSNFKKICSDYPNLFYTVNKIENGESSTLIIFLNKSPIYKTEILDNNNIERFKCIDLNKDGRKEIILNTTYGNDESYEVLLFFKKKIEDFFPHYLAHYDVKENKIFNYTKTEDGYRPLLDIYCLNGHTFYLCEKKEYISKEYYRIIKFNLNGSPIEEQYTYHNKYIQKDITSKTLITYNNIAYYLQKAGANKEAAYLLEKIIKKFPNRTVAYYNLGDAYWALDEKQKAIKAYTTYIEQMCDKGLQNKIPKVVLERVSNKK